MSKSSIQQNHESLVVAFRIKGRKGPLIHLYPGLPYTKANSRSQPVKELQSLITRERWPELAERFPNCRHLDQYRAPRKLTDQTTFRAVSERFLAYHRAENSQATVRFYEQILRPHIWSTDIADKPIRLIDVPDIVALRAPLRTQGHLAQAKNVRRVLSAVFNWAKGVKGTDGQYLVFDNPSERMRWAARSEIDRAEDERINPFPAPEQAQIVAACRAGWERRLVVVALETGLRPGENFGLKRTDVDLKKRVVRVRQTWSRFREGRLKNERARRSVHLSEAAYRALGEQLAEVQRCATPWLWQMFPMTKVQPWNAQNFSRRQWPAILKRAGVAHRNFYQCRHTFATNLLGQQPNQYIADQMGHKDLTTLIEVYWRWQPGTVAAR